MADAVGAAGLLGVAGAFAGGLGAPGAFGGAGAFEVGAADAALAAGAGAVIWGSNPGEEVVNVVSEEVVELLISSRRAFTPADGTGSMGRPGDALPVIFPNSAKTRERAETNGAATPGPIGNGRVGQEASCSRICTGEATTPLERRAKLNAATMRERIML